MSLVLMLFSACNTGSGFDSPKESSESDADADADSDTDTDTDADADLPQDARTGIDPSEDCEKLQGQSHPGGAAWYWGEYLGNETDGWTGQEVWIFYPNRTAVAGGMSNCEVTWPATASATTTGSCAGCDLGLAVEAGAATSTCGADVQEMEAFSVDYAVKRLGDQTANWFFASSGNVLGTGYHAEGGLNYLTEGSCVWF